MQPDARRNLQQAQTELARALCGEADVPIGFDPSRLALAAASLRRKRLKSAMRAWPALKEAVEPRFADRFATYASRHPVPATPREDAANFARFLREQGELPEQLQRAERRERWRRRFQKLGRPILRLYK
jgi:hypothetical protein